MEITQQGCRDHAGTEDDAKTTNVTTSVPLEHIPENEPSDPQVRSNPHYSAFTEREKKFLVLSASLAAILSPLSTGTYYPAINVMASDLGVSIAQINLTISLYQIFQGLAPSLTGAVSERYGRRPAYFLCYAISLGANLGLALQSDYATLMVLRCLQSSGSSGTSIIGQSVVADLATRAERGRYIGWAVIGFTLGPALGPLIGGLLAGYLGWRAIFWFLMILCGSLLLLVVTCVRETNRKIVGNGSVPPQRWNRCLREIVMEKWLHSNRPQPDRSTLPKRSQHIDPLRTVKVLLDKESGLIILFGGLLYSGYVSVSSILTSQLHERYGLGEVNIGLCYIPLGLGSITSHWTSGRLMDRSFKRHAAKQGLTIEKHVQQDITHFDIEKARLSQIFPMVLFGCGTVTAYGWMMQYRVHLAGILVVTFLLANVMAGCLSTIATFLLDINPEDPSASSAAMNFARCLMSAGAVAAATPLINAIRIGWAATLTAGLWILYLPILWTVYQHGFEWRRKRSRDSGVRSESIT